MSENRVAFGTMIEILTPFIDYRRSSNKTNAEYKQGQIIPVDSLLLYSIDSILKLGQAKIRNDLTFEGYESDFILLPFQFTEYPLLKLKFKNAGSSVQLPVLNSTYEYKSLECLFINVGSVAFSIKYSDGSDFPNLLIEPTQAYKAIFMYDGTNKGRWIFEPILYRQDEVLEGNKGSDSISLGGAGASIKTLDYETSDDLNPGDFVSIYLDQTEIKCKKASALSISTKAIGFVKNVFTVGQFANIYISGLNEFCSNLNINTNYYLSETAGQIQGTIPNTDGSIIQKLGNCINQTSLNVSIEEEFEIIN